jgi:hypothetical protein
MTQLFSSADMALARRIEAGHAHSATVVTGAATIAAIAGGLAIFHAVDSPVTQAIGIGMNGAVGAADLDELEAFFHDRGSPAIIDLCTLVDSELVALLQQRGYVIREISNVLVRCLDKAEEFDDVRGIEVEEVRPGEMEVWAHMVLQGFAGEDRIPEEHMSMLTSPASGLAAFFGQHDGTRVATAAMAFDTGLATFCGASTLVHARGRGMQLVMIRHRLRIAAQRGCDIASASVVPGSASHRNYERAGFQLVYARIMVSKPHSSGNSSITPSAKGQAPQ